MLIGINVPFVIAGHIINLLAILFIATLWIDSASNYKFFLWVRSWFK